MKNKGFTLVEVLAMLVVLGIIMGITIPNITGILENQKVNTIIGDSKKMISSAKTEIITNNDMYLPKNNDQCVVLNLSKIDKNSDIKADADDEEYDRANSFILVKFNNKQYEYHVRLAAKRSDEAYYGIEDATEEQLNKDSFNYIEEFKKTDIKSLSNGVNVTSFSGDPSFNSCKNTLIYSGEDINPLSNDKKFFCIDYRRYSYAMRKTNIELMRIIPFGRECFKYKDGTTWNDFLNSEYNKVNDNNIVKVDDYIISLKDYLMSNENLESENSIEGEEVLKRENESSINYIFNINSGDTSTVDYIESSIPNCFEDYDSAYKCDKNMLNAKIRDSSQGFYTYDINPPCGAYGELCKR